MDFNILLSMFVKVVMWVVGFSFLFFPHNWAKYRSDQLDVSVKHFGNIPVFGNLLKLNAKKSKGTSGLLFIRFFGIIWILFMFFVTFGVK